MAVLGPLEVTIALRIDARPLANAIAELDRRHRADLTSLPERPAEESPERSGLGPMDLPTPGGGRVEVLAPSEP